LLIRVIAQLRIFIFYGVRVHIVARENRGKLPTPEYIGVTGASHHDGKIFDQIRPVLHNNYLYGDKAYLRSDAKQVMKDQNLVVLTPVKKQKGQNLKAMNYDPLKQS
jgi:hypothetical protein